MNKQLWNAALQVYQYKDLIIEFIEQSITTTVKSTKSNIQIAITQTKPNDSTNQ